MAAAAAGHDTNLTGNLLCGTVAAKIIFDVFHTVGMSRVDTLEHLINVIFGFV